MHVLAKLWNKAEAKPIHNTAHAWYEVIVLFVRTYWLKCEVCDSVGGSNENGGVSLNLSFF